MKRHAPGPKAVAEIRPLVEPAELRAAVELQRAVWGESFGEVVPPAILMAAQRVGGLCLGAFDPEGNLVGIAFGLAGWEGGRRVHWSDMLAVRPGLRDRGIGLLLKLRQRDRLLAEGVETILWSFEPLESRNAWVNLSRLGATAAEYRLDLYGDSSSPLHAGLGTDRLIVRWELGSERVRRRLAGGDRPPSAARARRVPLVNPPEVRRGLAQPGTLDTEREESHLRLAIPADIQRLRDRDAVAARSWRETTRKAFTAYFARGYRAVDLVREGEFSSYLLERAAPGAARAD